MNNHPIAINGIHYSRLSNAMIALGIPDSEYDRLYYAIAKKASFSHHGITIYFHNGKFFSKRSGLRAIKDTFPKAEAKSSSTSGRKPLMRALCTTFIGVDHGEHWL